jgi:N-acetylmuramoyl-L-alanine amidase
MDYIGKIKTIASGAVIAMVACTAITLTSSDKAVTSAQNVTTVTEETSSDDGSAPGSHLSNVNTNLVQSATIAFDCEDETEKETQILAEVETKTEVVVGQPETESTTTVVAEDETTQPSASVQSNESQQVANPEFVLEFSEEDYQVLCTIVEAEAGDQDAKGRILVANVIINRVKMEGKFGNTIKEVVFANNGKTYQFSPTRPGGRYYKVTASELTIECVDRALRGEDYSQGALYFCMKTSPNSWFNTSLQFLFKHQDHYFYK